MSMRAKALLVSNEPVASSTPGAAPEQHQLVFQADYNDGRNAEWAQYTPSLSLTMVVKAEIAEGYATGPWDLVLTPASGAGEFAAEHQDGEPIDPELAAAADELGGEPVPFTDEGKIDGEKMAGDVPPEAPPKSKR